MINAALNLQNNILHIVGIVMILISIVGMLLTLLWFFIYKKTVEYTIKNARALETVDYIPVLRWILNIHAVALKEKSNIALMQSFDILFRNYCEMYGDRFVLQCKQTTAFLDNNSSKSWPLITNYFLAKELNKKIEVLRLDARETIANAQEILELQLITRDWYVKINEKANFVLDMIKKQNEKRTPTSYEKWSTHSLNEFKIMVLNENVNNARHEISQAKYTLAIEHLKDVSSMLGDLTQLVDNTDKMNNLMDNILKERLKRILNEIKGINLSEEEKIKNTTAFSSLENSYWAFVKATKTDIYALRIKEAFKRCLTMIEQIKKHESNLKYEMLLKTFIKSNYVQFQNVLNHCYQDILKTSEVIEFNNKLGKKTVSQKQKLDEISKTFYNLTQKSNTFFKEQNDSKMKEYAFNYKKKGQEIKELYEKVKVMLRELSNLRSSMKSAENFKVEIEAKIISFKKMLLATELMVSKNPNIPELKKSTPIIQKLFEKLSSFEKALYDNYAALKSQKNIDDFSEYLDEANLSIAKMKAEIAQNIFIAKLAEMSLSYAARFGGIETIDNEIKKSIDDFENARYKECLNKNLTFLKNIKNSNRGAIA